MKTDIIFYHISLSCSYNEKCFRQKLWKQSKHILCSVTFFFFFENLAVYEIMWKNFVEQGRLQLTIWRTRIACWLPKATDTRSGCVTLIALPLQQRLH
jgi:hypothetical protein